MSALQYYIDKTIQAKSEFANNFYKTIQKNKNQYKTYYLCLVFNNDPYYVITTKQPSKTYPSLTLVSITLNAPYFCYTKKIRKTTH